MCEASTTEMLRILEDPVLNLTLRLELASTAACEEMYRVTYVLEGDGLQPLVAYDLLHGLLTTGLTFGGASSDMAQV
jgi:hypothetical protein